MTQCVDGHIEIAYLGREPSRCTSTMFFVSGPGGNLGLRGGGMNKSATAQCARAVSLFRGLYARVARDLGVDVSYISRIAHGKRKSKVVEKAIAREFNKVVAIMRNGPARLSQKPYIVVTLQCPLCNTPQKVHLDARPKFGQARGERVSCVSCGHHFKLTIPEKIIRGPFPA